MYLFSTLPDFNPRIKVKWFRPKPFCSGWDKRKTPPRRAAFSKAPEAGD